MTIQKALSIGYRKLKNTSDSPTLDAEVLFSYALKKPKEHLLVHMNRQVNAKQEKKFLNLIKKRKEGWPVAYLIFEKEFFGLEFYVNKNVLIPRPETETLVEIVVKQINMTYFARPRILRSGLKILDLGTGSGCIIISLAKSLSLFPPSLFPLSYFASDISQKALAVAKKNAKFHKVKVTFKQGDLLKPWLARRPVLRSSESEGGSLGEGGKNEHFDVIVANLPYLARLEDPSTEFEPRRALVSGKGGLALYEKLFKQISSLREVRSFDRTTKQSQPKYIFVEFHPLQATQIKKLAKKYLPKFKVEFKKDLTKRVRFALLAYR